MSVIEDGITDVITAMLESIPKVSIGMHMHHTNFTIDNKVFAFTRKDGVALKLPESRARTLVDQGVAIPLTMGKRTMREWIVLSHPTIEQYTEDTALFKEAIASIQARG